MYSVYEAPYSGQTCGLGIGALGHMETTSNVHVLTTAIGVNALPVSKHTYMDCTIGGLGMVYMQVYGYATLRG